VRNDSGADQERFAVLGIDAPLILPTENPAAFQERVALSLVAPDADQHRDRMCILQEPIAAGALGRGLIVGLHTPTAASNAPGRRASHVLEPRVTITNTLPGDVMSLSTFGLAALFDHGHPCGEALVTRNRMNQISSIGTAWGYTVFCWS